MMKRALRNSVIGVVLSVATLASAGTVRIDQRNAEALAQIMITAPRPDYPVEARAKHITGYGLYNIWFRTETGVVSHIEILRSTGSKLLDEAALRAFRQWRARPGAVSHMKIPVTFSM